MDFVLARARLRWLPLLLCIALFAGCTLTIPASPTPTRSTIPASPTPTRSTISPGTTPVYQPFQALLKKVAAVGPVYITGDSSVSDSALQVAGTLLATMLQHRPDIGVVLRARGAFTAVSF